MTEQPQEKEQRWIGIVPTAEAMHMTRSNLDCLKAMTNPNLRRRVDPTSARKNRILYDLDDMTAWLDYHIGLHPVQRDQLEEAAVVVIPSLFEKELVQ